MILEARAEYDAATDTVQISTIVQEDTGVSAAEQVASGVAEIIQGTETQYSAAFSAQDVVLVENEGVYSDIGRFIAFVVHPSMQMGMRAKCTVTLNDGRAATRQVPVEYRYVGSQMPTTNPALSGIENMDFPLDPDKP
jgi:hypothetical protein